jgi:hypothetical protein
MFEETLVEIKVSRNKGELLYSVDCSSELTNEELEYYLTEIIKGLCSWKPGVCTEHFKNFEGKIKKQKK